MDNILSSGLMEGVDYEWCIFKKSGKYRIPLAISADKSKGETRLKELRSMGHRDLSLETIFTQSGYANHTMKHWEQTFGKCERL